MYILHLSRVLCLQCIAHCAAPATCRPAGAPPRSVHLRVRSEAKIAKRLASRRSVCVLQRGGGGAGWREAAALAPHG
eukprot:scaffold9747_cov156-Isochrysis_galbana.AAC.1